MDLLEYLNRDACLYYSYITMVNRFVPDKDGNIVVDSSDVHEMIESVEEIYAVSKGK